MFEAYDIFSDDMFMWRLDESRQPNARTGSVSAEDHDE
jgi:hypothetical protein